MFNKLIFVFMRKNNVKKTFNETESKSMSKGHFETQFKQILNKNLLIVGPLDGAGGIYIFDGKTLSKDEVKDILDQDPFIKNGLFINEYHELNLPDFFDIKILDQDKMKLFYENLINQTS